VYSSDVYGSDKIKNRANHLTWWFK